MSNLITIQHLSDIARVVEGELVGEDGPFSGVSTDSRSIAAGQLFVALKGPNFDGERFLPMAEQQGAAAALVSRPIDSPLPQIVVEDTLQGLGQLAAAWRQQFTVPLLAITGSNGKTTVKEMVAAILQQQGPGTVTQGNLNNEIGVPLTLLQMKPEDCWAVVEMGASAVGDIDYLARMAAPTASLVNNAGAAHLGGFGSRQQIVEAKGEIYSALPRDGVAVINQSLPQQAVWQEMAAGHSLFLFGYTPAEAVELSGSVALEYPFTLHYQGETVGVELLLSGAHNRSNALAAAALSLQAGATLRQIQVGLEQVQSVPGRLYPLPGRGGSRLIDDCYNASPESMQSAIAVLAAESGRRILVAGDMGELGEDAAQLHRAVGETAAAVAIDQLYTLGEYATDVVAGFGAGGVACSSLESLLSALEPELQPNTVVLIKGSRFMKMERIVEALTIEVQQTAGGTQP